MANSSRAVATVSSLVDRAVAAMAERAAVIATVHSPVTVEVAVAVAVIEDTGEDSLEDMVVVAAVSLVAMVAAAEVGMIAMGVDSRVDTAVVEAAVDMEEEVGGNYKPLH